VSWLSSIGEKILPGHGAGVVGAATAAVTGGAGYAPLGAALAGDLPLSRALGAGTVAVVTVVAPPAAPAVFLAVTLQDIVLARVAPGVP